jgi:hypothetical protein
MQTICSAYGQVLRIVIFKKNGVQAMIEFENIECATRAKQSLNGASFNFYCFNILTITNNTLLDYLTSTNSIFTHTTTQFSFQSANCIFFYSYWQTEFLSYH